MLRMLATFWAVMSTAGLITEGLFRVTGLVPTVKPGPISPPHFQWNYTTYLNIVFLALFGLLYWVYRNRQRLGGEAGEGKGEARATVSGPPTGTQLHPCTRASTSACSFRSPLATWSSSRALPSLDAATAACGPRSIPSAGEDRGWSPGLASLGSDGVSCNSSLAR